ncbi:MAG: amidohydrolase family protein [Gemmatimonadota bacterium]|nr:amidohydrolase family protein [Gemmatimonadota bacterium]
MTSCERSAPFLWVTVLILSAGPVHAQTRTVLHGVTLIDGRGGAPLSQARIIIEHGRFTCVSGPDGCPAVPTDRQVDLTGRWMTPGLIDTHVHLPFGLAPDGLPRQQRLRFALGITTVRDADSRSVEVALARRSALESADSTTPRLVVSARVTPEYAERFGVPIGAPLVEQLARMGVEAIKLKEPFGDTLWLEELRTAKRLGLPVYGHTWGGPPPIHFTRAAVLEGVSGITHLMGIALEIQPAGVSLTPPDSATEAEIYAWGKTLWESVSPARADSMLTIMLERGVWLEPTLATEFHWGRDIPLPAALDFLGEARRLGSYLPGRARAPGRAGPVVPAAWTPQAALVGNFILRGGLVIAGSDGKLAGLALHEEMRLIGEAAGSPMAGLLAATRNAAIALGRDDLGTIQPGKTADAVIYSVDPLGASDATLEILEVIKGGVPHQSDSLLAEFHAEYDLRVRAAWRGRVIRGLKVLLVVAVVGGLLLLAWRRLRRA